MTEPEVPARTFRIGIFWVLSVLLVLLVVVPMVSYSWKVIDKSRENIEDSLRERQLKTAIAAASHIENLMDSLEKRLDNLAGTFEVFANDDRYKTDFEGLLQRGILERNLSDDTLLLIYQDREGGQFAAPWKGLAENERTQLTTLVVPLGRQVIESSAKSLSPIFFVRLAALGGLSRPAVAFSMPLKSDNKPVASLSAIFLLDGVEESLMGYDFSLFVTDDHGHLIFHSEQARQGKPEDLSGDPTVERVLASGSFPTNAINYTVTRISGRQTETDVVTCAPITSYRWLLFSQVDRERYYAPIVQLRHQSTLWILLSILGALAIGLFLARQITRPLSNLTEVSRDLARGKFDRRADVRSRMEIGELAGAFNAMADDIQNYIHKVEAAAEETQQLFMDSIRAITNALDAKDPYTRGHSDRVCAYALIIGREYGLDESQLRTMEISSLLHDVGKIGIEDRILRKPGALTAEEFDAMKTHPPKGASILGGIPQMRDIIPGIRHHHERWRGGGYPDGLKQEDIPLLARIIGVADAFDAMTTNRPYQKGMTFDNAASKLNDLSQASYDPTVIAAFNRAYRSGAFLAHQQRVTEQKLA